MQPETGRLGTASADSENELPTDIPKAMFQLPLPFIGNDSTQPEAAYASMTTSSAAPRQETTTPALYLMPARSSAFGRLVFQTLG
jgi:hypothetical protein